MSQITQRLNGKKKLFVGTIEAARLLHVDPSTVQRWVDMRILRSFRTVGGHRRISLRHLRDFASSRQVPIEPQSVTPRVLIVDDEPDILQMLRIRINGYRPDIEVLTADHGFNAGFSVYQHRPGLVLLDIRMPGLDGVGVCKMIKDDPSTQDIRVVGVTASRDPIEIDALLAAGAEAVLPKPVQPSALHHVLDHCFPRPDTVAPAEPIEAYFASRGTL